MHDPDRLFRGARREALVVALVWMLALLWVVGYCYLRGYSHPADSWVVRNGLAAADQVADQGQVFGFPVWIIWGIGVPWLVCTAFTVLYGAYGMTDEDLGADDDDRGPGHGH